MLKTEFDAIPQVPDGVWMDGSYSIETAFDSTVMLVVEKSLHLPLLNKDYIYQTWQQIKNEEQTIINESDFWESHTCAIQYNYLDPL